MLVLGSKIGSWAQGRSVVNEQGKLSSCPNPLLWGLTVTHPYLVPSGGCCVRLCSLAEEKSSWRRALGGPFLLSAASIISAP